MIRTWKCEQKELSRLMQPRGLKSTVQSPGIPFGLSRLMQPRGLKFSFYLHLSYYIPVEAYAASWIEIPWICRVHQICGSRLMQPRGLKFWLWIWRISIFSRGLCSLVDWNRWEFCREPVRDVEAYAASWIEIKLSLLPLKNRMRRGLCSLVDWNGKIYH